MNSDELCPITDLPTGTCGCTQHHRPEATVISISALERLAGRPLPEYRIRKRDTEWQITEPKEVRCTHRNDDLCGPCSQILEGLLADTPAALTQLRTALWKDVKFAPRGFKKGDVETPDESPIPWNPSAYDVLDQMRRIIIDAPGTDRHTLLADLSRVMRKAHRVIDRPRDREITMCPECRSEIPVISHSLAVTCGARIVEDDPDAPEPEEGKPWPQRIRVCAYTAAWDQHYRNLIEACSDACLTMSDLLLIFGGAGEKIDRNRINYLIKRHGLPREKMQQVWVQDGQLQSRDMWVYRLRDVLDLQSSLARKEAS